MQNSNYKIQIEILTFGNPYYGREIAKIDSKIYSKRKSENPQGSFEFERTRNVDTRALPKIFNKRRSKT